VVQKGGAAMTEKEILALEDKRFGAMIARDLKALEAMLHCDLLYTHSSGVTDTKESWLQSMQSGKTKHKSVNCTDRKIRVIGEVALVTGRAAIRGGDRQPVPQRLNEDSQPHGVRMIFEDDNVGVLRIPNARCLKKERPMIQVCCRRTN
jgi:hypothetical protein